MAEKAITAGKLRPMPDHWQEGELAPSWFLSKTTCFNQENTFHWICQHRRYFLLKHKGHSEWCGWGSGNKYCPTTFTLFDWEDENVNAGKVHMGLSGLGFALWHHEGRLTKAKMEEMEHLCNPYK